MAPAARTPHARETILIAAHINQRREVVCCCTRAQGAGVAPGMTISDARALLGPRGNIQIIDHAPERDAAALRALARWTVRFSPRVALDPPDGLLLDITGCARVHGGEQRLLERLTSSLHRLDIAARAAIAPTFGCAWGVARFGDCVEQAPNPVPPTAALSGRCSSPQTSNPPHILRGGRWTLIPEGAVRPALRDLPTAALRIDDKAVAGLAEVGVERIGELLALPRTALRPRFGPELSQRIAQALGEAIETIEPVRPAPPLRAERLFDGPTSRWEAIAMVARDLVDDLCGQLASRERGAMRLELTLDRSDTDPVTLEIQLAGPSRDGRHLWSLLRPKLERANMGFGVERMELAAPRSARIAHRQGLCCKGRWRADGAETQQRQRHKAELIDALSSRLGVERVLRARMVESHIPERACQMAPALRTESRAQRGGRRNVAPAVTCGDRPTMLLARPEPAQVITVAPDGPVLSVTWRGETLRILASIGPERIEAEWWRHTRRAPARDYFKLQDARGRWLWLFRQRSRRQNAEVAEGARRAAEYGVSCERQHTACSGGNPNAQASGSCGSEPSQTFESGTGYNGAGATPTLQEQRAARFEGSPNAQASGGCAPEPSSTFDAPACSEPEGLIDNSRGWSATPTGWSDTPGNEGERGPTPKGSSKRRPSPGSLMQPAPSSPQVAALPGALPEAPRSPEGKSDRDGMIPIPSERGDRRRDLGGTGGTGTGWFVHGMWV